MLDSNSLPMNKGGNEMKLITAIIQPEKLPDVKEALITADVCKMTVSNVIGCGQQQGYKETYRGVNQEVKLIKKVKVEIVVTEPFLKKTIDAIVSAAKTGTIGDGKIWVTTLDECIRIRTGENGNDAVG
jgi:nitrogen regulatory protein P-II 2